MSKSLPRPPNPRLQRTPSRAPLSRQPLGAPKRRWRLMSLVKIGAFVLLIASTTSAVADDNGKLAAAEPVVSAWVALLDAGRYEECWSALSETTKSKLPKDQWVLYLTGVRKPMGDLKARKRIKAEYVASLKNLPEQEGAIFAFESTFEKRADVRETFGLIHDKDGQWRVGHYLTN